MLLSSALQERGHEVLMFDAKEYPHLTENEVSPLGMMPAPGIDVPHTVIISPNLAYSLIKYNPDIIIIHAFDTAVYKAVQAIKSHQSHAKIKIVWRMGSNPFEHHLVHHMYPQPNLRHVMIDHMALMCDAVLAPSHYAANIAAMAGAENIFVIPPAIKPNTYLPSPYEGRRFVMVGRLENANYTLAPLRAFRAVVAEHPECTMTIAGYGSHADAIRTYVEQFSIPNVKLYTGTDIAYQPADFFFEQADIALHPAVTAMGINVSVLESLASGCCTVVSYIPAFMSAISEGACIPVDVCNTYLWYKVMTDVIENTEIARKAIQNGIKYIWKHDIKTVGKQLVEAIELVGGDK